MKRIFLLTGLILSSFITSFAQEADAITGVWLNEEQDGKVEIYKSGDKYFGKIVWTKYIYEPDGKTINKDDKNPDAKLREQPIIGLVVLSDLSYNKGMWTDGKAYDPKSGKTYSARMKLKGTTLEIRGYIGKPILGVTTVWTKKS